MESLHVNELLDLVRGGNAEATDHLKSLLRIVVGHGVRRALHAEDYGSPLGQRVQGLLAEAGSTMPTDGIDAATATARRITQAICGQTVARLRSEGRSACDTVVA